MTTTLSLRATATGDDLVSRADRLTAMPFADIALELSLLRPAERAELFELLPAATARGGFLAMDPEAQALLLDEIDEAEARSLLVRLPPYVLARICEQASAALERWIRANLPAERAARLERLLREPLGSVLRIMQTDFLSLPGNVTVADALAALRGSPEPQDVVFVHDQAGRLQGGLRAASLLGSPPERLLGEMLECGVSRLSPGDSRARAARLLQHSILPCLPVVGDDGRQVGLVRFDEAMDVLEQENSEDVYRKAGMGRLGDRQDMIRSERLTTGGIAYPVRVRLLFLMVTLAGGLLVGGLIDTFEETLAAVVAIAVFIPLIMDMGGNVGTQSTTIFARGYALGHIDVGNGFFRRHVTREGLVGVSMALILGVMAGTIAYFWQGVPNGIPVLGLAVGISLFVSVLTASVLGFLLPWLMLKIGVDHAPGADPFITTIKDFSGLAVYFLLCAALLQIEV